MITGLIISFIGGFLIGGLVLSAMLLHHLPLARTPFKNHSVTPEKIRRGLVKVPIYAGIMVPDHCHTGKACIHCGGNGHDLGLWCPVCYGTGVDLLITDFIRWKLQLS